jgi:hypothetical protein
MTPDRYTNLRVGDDLDHIPATDGLPPVAAKVYDGASPKTRWVATLYNAGILDGSNPN